MIGRARDVVAVAGIADLIGRARDVVAVAGIADLIVRYGLVLFVAGWFIVRPAAASTFSQSLAASWSGGSKAATSASV